MSTTTGQRVGYVRVSTVDQNTARQLDGVAVDRTFTDKASGKDAARPQLAEALKYVREGDTLVVHSMDRLARNVEDLRRIVRDLTAAGVRVEFVKEALTFSGEDSAMSNLLLTMLGAVAEFERVRERWEFLASQRQREGIALAKARGAYKGTPFKLTRDVVETAKVRRDEGERTADLAAELGVSKSTLQLYFNNPTRGA